MIVTRDSFLAPIRAPLSIAAGPSEKLSRNVSSFSKVLSASTCNCVVISSGPPGTSVICPACSKSDITMVSI